MRLTVLLLLLLASTASAQAPLFPTGDAGRAASHWRAALSAGAAEDVAFAIVSLGVDRTLGSLLVLGARVSVPVSGSGFSDDGPSTTGVAGELRASAGTALRAFDLRVFAGGGVSAFRTSSGFGIDVPPEAEPRLAAREPRRVRGHAIAGVGLDVYPAAGVGVGVELRGTLPTGAAELSAGLRVRLAR